MPFWELFSVVIAPLILTVASAQQPPDTIMLARDTDYANVVRTTLAQQAFTTDITGRVAAETTSANVEVFIINNSDSAQVGDVLSYRVVVRNSGSSPADSITIQNKLPDGTGLLVSNPAGEFNDESNIIAWREDGLAPGATQTYTFSAEVQQSPGNQPTDQLVLEYFSQETDPVTGQAVRKGPLRTASLHTITPPPAAGAAATGTTPPKQPAIICDPSERSCTQILPSLGINFQAALNPAKQPRICEGLDRGAAGCAPNYPQLGVRFQEAYASAVPGECSVLRDEIIADPAFHDSLNRGTDPAAFYMRPLYDSGMDFRQLIHENAVLGIRHEVAARTVLRRIHMEFWDHWQQGIEDVLTEKQTTDYIRQNMAAWRQTSLQQVNEAQQELARQYQTMQDERRQKFDPVAQQAVANARLSLQRACGIAGDGGLSGLLPAVKQAYEANLQQQSAAYQQMQNVFGNPNHAQIPPAVRAQAFENRALAALSAFDGGNKQPLEEIGNEIGHLEQFGFAEAFGATYLPHFTNERAGDNLVRLQHWEIALDTPKSQATACEHQRTAGPPVETTWCESNGYREFLGPTSITAAQRNPDAVPPNVPFDGFTAVIDQNLTIGSACSGRPGDPYWAADCSCNCGDLVLDVVEGRIVPCPVDQTKQIINHDISVTSQLECLRDSRNHLNPAQTGAAN